MADVTFLSAIGRSLVPRTKALASVSGHGRGWWPIVAESFAGAWQKNVEVRLEDSLQYWPVFRCVSLISSDVAKLGLVLKERDANGIRRDAHSPAFSPVLRRPNPYQNRIQFIQNWLESKLTRGNAYVLLGRDNREVVTRMHILDPARVRPLVSDSTGEVFYELHQDNLARVGGANVIVPASEIIHDRWNTFYHPLVGLSPIHAAGVNALAGRNIVNNSAQFFGNASVPSGILVAPGPIDDATAARVKEAWEANYRGENAGRTAILGDGMEYKQMTITALDAQLIEQLKWSAETICGVFGVPSYMVITSNAPTYNNVEALQTQYYSQCLQILIEAIELCLDEGLRLPDAYGTEFDLDDLMRMDTATAAKTEGELVKAGIGAPNEARARFNRRPVAGGDTPYLQQQNYSLAALDERDRNSPLLNDQAGQPPAPPEPDNDNSEEEARSALLEIYKGFR